MSEAITNEVSAAGDAQVSRARLIVLRVLYGLIALGLALFVWPVYLAQLPAPPHYQGVVLTMLGAFSILCVVGIRYPLQMLPILLWELLWKSMWLLLIALPRWSSGTMDPLTGQAAFDCALVVILLPALPWRYLLRNYVTKPAERASVRPAAAAGAA